MTPQSMAMYTAMSLSSRGEAIDVIDAISIGVVAVALLILGVFVGVAVANIVSLCIKEKEDAE